MNNKIEAMSNKITDMTLNGATEEELSQAITESMKVIDDETGLKTALFLSNPIFTMEEN